MSTFSFWETPQSHGYKVRKIQLRKGEVFFHATPHTGFTMPRGPAWFSDNSEVARRMSCRHQRLHDGVTVPEHERVRLMEFQLIKNAQMAQIDDLFTFAAHHGITVQSPAAEVAALIPPEVAGWHSPINYGRPTDYYAAGHIGSDTMFVEPEKWLRWVKTRWVRCG